MFDFGIDIAWRSADQWGRPSITMNFVCGCWMVWFSRKDEDWTMIDMGRGNSRLCRFHEHVVFVEDDPEIIHDRALPQ